MACNERHYMLGVLIRYEAAGDLRVRLAGGHCLLSRSLVASPHSVDLERRSRPLSLERRVARLAERRWRADLREIRGFVEGQGRDVCALGLRKLAYTVVEAGNGNAATGLMQRRDQARHCVQRVGDATPVPPRVKILGCAGDGELEPGESATRDGDRRFVDAPHRPVCG